MKRDAAPAWVRPLIEACVDSPNGRAEVTCGVLGLRCPVPPPADERGDRVHASWSHEVGPVLARHGFIYRGTDFTREAVAVELPAGTKALLAQLRA